MHSILKKIPFISYCAFSLLLMSMLVVSLHRTKETMLIVSLLMFITCVLSAVHLYGPAPVIKFIVLSQSVAYFAEYMGSNYGWFFGSYHFTDALGPALFNIPIVIPLMWFNLAYICMVLGNILLYRSVFISRKSWPQLIASSFLGALLVTAYDLGADPYMVFVVKAWVMHKTDGWWFGETLQGFVGWMVISFVILLGMNLLMKATDASSSPPFKKYHALIPISIYANLMGFQMLYGFPVETRTIALFAMGIPLVIALFSFQDWKWDEGQ